MQEICTHNPVARNAEYLHSVRMSHATPIDKAIAAVGGEDEFMDRLGIKRRTLFYWRADGIPPVRLAAVARATGLPANELRPDLFAPNAA
jgi:DNA-binding transcriptional regulator YdaS (Cro superfamily)